MSTEVQASNLRSPVLSEAAAGLSLGGDGRGRPTPLVELSGPDKSDPEGLLSCLKRIEDAVRTNFPENIFFDLDWMACHLGQLDIPHRDESTTLIEQLHRDYGQNSLIGFRYVHDFLYGFDWAKWVRRDPKARASVGPYDRVFLVYLRQRGKELVELINNDDQKYPKLPDGTPRNPFGFSREPEDETLLYRTLKAEGLIPVLAWTNQDAASLELDFEQRRRQVAHRLQTADERQRA